jgi:hypothetical protein
VVRTAGEIKPKRGLGKTRQLSPGDKPGLSGFASGIARCIILIETGSLSRALIELFGPATGSCFNTLKCKGNKLKSESCCDAARGLIGLAQGERTGATRGSSSRCDRYTIKIIKKFAHSMSSQSAMPG